MKTARLLGIFIKLLEERKIYCAELAEEFSVSPRTIKKDIKTLKGIGLPVSSRPGKGGGYYLDDSYHHTRQYLSLEDLLEITSRLEGQDYVFGNQEQAIDRIYQAIPDPKGENLLAEVEFEITPSGMRESLLEKLKWFYQRQKGPEMIEIFRLQQEDQSLRQKIKPRELFYYSRNWFLYGYLPENQNYELISLTAILQYRILGKRISLKEQQEGKKFCYFAAEADQLREKELNEKELELIGSPAVLEELKQHNIFQKVDDGTSENSKCLKLKMKSNDLEEIKGIILSRGSQIKILKPEWLKREIFQEAKKILRVYSEFQQPL